MDLLRQSCDELGQTIVVVTHDPRAAAYADRVVFLRDGQIACELKYDEVDDLAQRLRVIMNAMENLQI
jgi:putative ABC transport system ATP-binding protein